MLAWLYGPGAQWFLPVGIESEPIEPGDLLLVRYGHVPHHLALALSQGRVVHVSMRHGVQILPSMPRRFLRYISHRFRILPEIGGRPNV
jgi:cell wall-associated NlpC family hydrolase